MKGENETALNIESTEDFIARGGKIEIYKEGKVSKRARKARENKEEKVDIKALIAKANPEQARTLRRIAKEQGIDVD